MLHKIWAVQIVTVLSLTQLAMGQQRLKLNKACPRDEAIATFQQKVKAVDGTIDVVHLKEGIAIVVTSKTPAGVKTVQDAARQYLATTFDSRRLEVHCRSIQRAITRQKISVELRDTASGVLLVYVTHDPALLVTIQGDCCKWCVCPAGSHTGCAKCC